MASVTSFQPAHRNSLGYVIADRGAAGRSAQAMIVWGRRADGMRVSIREAKRGAGEHLKCECGSELVARKGEINAYHFAHASGGARSCRQAQLAALSAFAERILTAGRRLMLPVLQGRQSDVALTEVSACMFEGCAGVLVASKGGVGRREMAVLCALQRGQAVPDQAYFASQRRSAILIDLAPYRNACDEELASAITRTADRRWLYNDRYPHAAQEQARLDQPNRARRGAPGRRSAPASGSRSLPVAGGEHRTLTPAELLRRLFGDKYAE